MAKKIQDKEPKLKRVAIEIKLPPRHQHLTEHVRLKIWDALPEIIKEAVRETPINEPRLKGKRLVYTPQFKF